MSRGPGRPRGQSDTKATILEAARRLFAEKGYSGATIRGIAREAGVDPALVHHYYAGKENLFVAAMRLPFEPGELVPRVIAGGPRDELGVRLARTFLQIWEDPEGREPFLAILRSAVTTEQAATMMREFVTSALLQRIVPAAGVPPVRVEAAIAQLFGMALFRYVLRVEPMASASTEELVQLLAPAIQLHLSPEAVDGRSPITVEVPDKGVG